MIGLAAASLVLYGNVAALFFAGGLPGGSVLAAALGVAFVAVVVAGARRSGLTLADLGLTRRRALEATIAGAVLAAVAALGALAVLRFPPILGEPVSYGPAAAIGGVALVVHVLVLLPLAVVIPEELAFRGWLLAALQRRYRTLPAVAISAGVFMLWHMTIVGLTLGQTSLAASAVFTALGAAVAFLAVFAGGVAFALLRIVTGHLAAPIAAHWGFNAALLVGLRWLA
ncbi:MAG: lysostaphin resistance A-like protein [Candidatus Limnocylindria bacterium]